MRKKWVWGLNGHSIKDLYLMVGVSLVLTPWQWDILPHIYFEDADSRCHQEVEFYWLFLRVTFTKQTYGYGK